MISLKKHFVLAAATVLLAACGGGSGGGGGGGGGNPVVTLDNSAVQAAIQAAVNKPEDQQPFRWEVAPTLTTVTVTVNLQHKADLTVSVYRCAEETTREDGSIAKEVAPCDPNKVQLSGDQVGFGTTGVDGKVTNVDGTPFTLNADKTENVMVVVQYGPVMLEYQGKQYRIVRVDQIGTLAF